MWRWDDVGEVEGQRGDPGRWRIRVGWVVFLFFSSFALHSAN